jgi:uncharacterized protein
LAVDGLSENDVERVIIGRPNKTVNVLITRFNSDTRQFLSLVFLFSIVASVLNVLTINSNGFSQIIGLAVMWSPALCALISAKVNRGPISGFKKFSLKLTLLSMFLIVGISHFFTWIGLAMFLEPGLWKINLSSDNGLIRLPLTLGFGESVAVSEFLLKAFLKMLVGLLIVSLFTLGEEIGWRGFLLPRLQNRFATKQAFVLAAALWAAWHIPFSLSGLHAIPGVPKTTLMIIMPVGLFGVGIFLNWLFLRTQSIWVVTLAHGALNNWSQIFFRWFVEAQDSVNVVLIASQQAGLILLGFGALFLVKTAEPSNSRTNNS